MGKYEEALERARQGLPMDKVFPELKISEDERIREGIIHFILYEAGNQLDEETEHAFITWLEKQKEPDGVWTEEDDAKVKAMCEEGDLKPSEREWLKKLKNRIAKKEQKPAERSEDDVDKVASIVYKFIRKILDSFGYYSEEKELIDSKEALLCYFGLDCAEEIIEFLRLQPNRAIKRLLNNCVSKH